MERNDGEYADKAPERDAGGDLMPEGMSSHDQQSTESAADKIAGAMEFVIQGQPDTPQEYGRMGK